MGGSLGPQLEPGHVAQVGSEAGKAGTIREGHLSLPGVSTGLEQDQGRGL